jgi:hypothetical protein
VENVAFLLSTRYTKPTDWFKFHMKTDFMYVMATYTPQRLPFPAVVKVDAHMQCTGFPKQMWPSRT